jgi:hypothetical protein
MRPVGNSTAVPYVMTHLSGTSSMSAASKACQQQVKHVSRNLTAPPYVTSTPFARHDPPPPCKHLILLNCACGQVRAAEGGGGGGRRWWGGGSVGCGNSVHDPAVMEPVTPLHQHHNLRTRAPPETVPPLRVPPHTPPGRVRSSSPCEFARINCREQLAQQRRALRVLFCNKIFHTSINTRTHELPRASSRLRALYLIFFFFSFIPLSPRELAHASSRLERLVG